MNVQAPHPPAALSVFSNLIGGKCLPAADGRVIDVVCPSDGLAFATLPRSDATEIDAAVRAARAAFEGPWSRP